MPDQPADPIHYDMRVPPEPKNRGKERDAARKHGDKINIEGGTKEKGANDAPKENREQE